MSILSDVNQQLVKMSAQAKKKYELARIDFRIKAYAKEEAILYNKLGRAIYTNYRHMLREEELKLVCDSVDAIRGRLKDLDKQKASISQQEESNEAQAMAFSRSHQMLDKKDSDLTFTRTNSGVKIIRICPQCQNPNAPDDVFCQKCQYEFIYE